MIAVSPNPEKNFTKLARTRDQIIPVSNAAKEFLRELSVNKLAELLNKS
jgi:hypothetical protein